MPASRLALALSLRLTIGLAQRIGDGALSRLTVTAVAIAAVAGMGTRMRLVRLRTMGRTTTTEMPPLLAIFRDRLRRGLHRQLMRLDDRHEARRQRPLL
jgi:hypothetical protein